MRIRDPGLNLPASPMTSTLSLRHLLLFQSLSTFKLQAHFSTLSAYVLISTRCQHFRFSHVKTRRNRCSALSCASPSFHHFCFLSSHLLPSLPYPTCINFHLHPSSSLILSAIVRVDVEHTVKVVSSYIIKGFCFLKVIQFLPEWSHRVQLFEEMPETIFSNSPQKMLAARSQLYHVWFVTLTSCSDLWHLHHPPVSTSFWPGASSVTCMNSLQD